MKHKKKIALLGAGALLAGAGEILKSAVLTGLGLALIIPLLGWVFTAVRRMTRSKG